jgi:hypothetical protein
MVTTTTLRFKTLLESWHSYRERATRLVGPPRTFGRTSDLAAYDQGCSQVAVGSAHAKRVIVPNHHAPHGCDEVAEVARRDPNRRLSTHRTSQGAVVYYRCYCGRPMVGLIARA